MVTKIGHRGAMGHAPENTLTSFEKAIQLGVDMIELDVRLSKDLQVVVFHDDKLKRLTNSKGYVYKKTIEELKSLSLCGGEKITTLKEALNFINRRAKVNIEIKGKNSAGNVSQIIEEFVSEKGWNYDDFIVSSFRLSELKKIKKLNENIRLGVLKDIFPLRPVLFAKKLGAYSIHFSYRFANKRKLKRAKREGFKVYVWTINDEKVIKKMKDLGVDGIFSDYPERL